MTVDAAERIAAIRALADEGLSLRKIGAELGISGERVRQVLAAHGETIQTRERKRLEVQTRRLMHAVTVVARLEFSASRHDMAGYWRGCRCETCRAANRESHRLLLGRDPPSHGLSGYMNYGCRCETCRAAGARKNAARYQKEAA